MTWYECYNTHSAKQARKPRSYAGESTYISSHDSIHVFNHSLLFLSDLWSNRVNTDVLTPESYTLGAVHILRQPK